MRKSISAVQARLINRNACFFQNVFMRYFFMPPASSRRSVTKVICERGDSYWYEKKKLFIEYLYKCFKKNNSGWKWCYEGRALSIAVGIAVLALIPANGANFLFR